MIVCETVVIPTAADGSGTGYTGIVNGIVRAIRYAKVSYENGVDFAVTAGTSGLNIWTQTNVNASVDVYPQAAVSDTAGVAALYAAGGTAVLTPIPVSDERIQIAVTSATAGTTPRTGTFYVYVDRG